MLSACVTVLAGLSLFAVFGLSLATFTLFFVTLLASSKSAEVLSPSHFSLQEFVLLLDAMAHAKVDPTMVLSSSKKSSFGCNSGQKRL